MVSLGGFPFPKRGLGFVKNASRRAQRKISAIDFLISGGELARNWRRIVLAKAAIVDVILNAVE